MATGTILSYSQPYAEYGMASGIIQTEGYKQGDSITRYLRSTGRIVNAGNAIYTYVKLNKPILTKNINLTLSGAINLYKVGGSMLRQNGNITVNDSYYDTIVFSIPITTVEDSGTIVYCECNINIAFS